jgi:hypothetical protein
VPVLRPRNRLVIFRLSEEEYQNLKAACVVKEARSLSDFARSAVLGSVDAEEINQESLEKRLSGLGRRLSELEAGIQHILRLLEGMNVREPGDSRKELARRTEGRRQLS